MKTLAELEHTLRAELTAWNQRQIRNPHEDHYLYYLATTPEHDGGILICAEQPTHPDYRLALAERINKGATIEQNFHAIRLGVLRTLPVLSNQ